ncbi:uncharacterized protein LOC124288154 [Haliotis rubra]|uniref:uncharacterized protein LOC124288154 n=1 Tax=Haliotis rubra TaxID=36100 RepID=UPI001EE4F337|nr:uncharacterized protein LOC124288154 [Haliotis rubra]
MGDKPEIVYKEINLPDDLKHKLAFVLENVLTPEECQWYIDETERRGYILAQVNTGVKQVTRTDIRNSSRNIWDSEEEAKKIWDRIKEFVPEVFSERRVMGLNERLRFLRYNPGEYFKPHEDGVYQRDNGERSYITVQVYLNEGFVGGSTTFFSYRTKDSIPVVPKTGSVLVFQHDMLHEGSTLLEGRKYTIRTDVMYSAQRVPFTTQ